VGRDASGRNSQARTLEVLKAAHEEIAQYRPREPTPAKAIILPGITRFLCKTLVFASFCT
jgi:hypothetical protein